MKIKLDYVFLNVDGDPLEKRVSDAKKTKETEPEFINLRDIIIDSLLTPIQGDEPDVKYEKYRLFQKIASAENEADLKLEETLLIKKAVGKLQPQIIMGQVWDLLDQ
jgi:hypothetical protein